MKKKLNVILSVLICLALCLSAASCSKPSTGTDNGDGDSAQPVATYEYFTRELPDYTSYPAAEKFAAGSGTEDSPYEISNAAELALLADLVNSDDTTREYAGACYKLTADITLNTGSAEDWTETAPDYAWTPIGVKNAFTGTFDGDSHTIGGIYLNADKKEQDGLVFGLFGKLQGTVKNVRITDSYFCVSGITSELGSIAGNANMDAQISGCSSDAELVIYDSDCGGIVGNATTAEIKDCSFSGVIRALKDYSFSNIGGIAGRSSAGIANCTNSGSLLSTLAGTEYAGGIVGRLSDGSVLGCTNSGSIHCTEGVLDESKSIEISGAIAGGIVGSLQSSNIGGEKYANKDITVSDCSNSGSIHAGNNAAGIIGSMNCMLNKSPVTVSDCSNTGEILSDCKSAGIIASASNSGVKLTVSRCSNTSDLSGNAAGIIDDLKPEAGEIEISDCSNTGSITGSSYAGGIINSIYIIADYTAELEIEHCSNTGAVSGTQAGGILGTMVNTRDVKTYSDAGIEISDCRNTGSISTEGLNNCIGGIAGCLGVKGIPTKISDCINTGDLTIDYTMSQETYDSDVAFRLCNMAGGIVGRIGEALYLEVVNSDGTDSGFTDAASPVVEISECCSSGNFLYPSDEELKNNEGIPVAVNRVGGIVGTSAASAEYAMRIEDCGFANADRGYGNEQHPDRGVKMSAAEIAAKISD